MEPKPAVARRGKQKAPIKSVIGPNGEYLLSKEQRQMRNMKRKLLRAQAKVARLKEKQEKEALQAAEDAKKRSKNTDSTNTDEDVVPASKKRKTAAKKTPANAESLNGAVETPVVASSSSTKKASKKNSEQTPLAALLAQALGPPLDSAANAASISTSASSNDATMSSSSSSAARTNITNTTNIMSTINNSNNISTNNNTAHTDSHSSIGAIHRFEEHLIESTILKDFARKHFFRHARCFKFTGSKGDYILWAYRKSGEMSAAGYAWPSAFVNDHTSTVHAAMWYVGKKNTLFLVSIWAYSPTEDKHNNYYLKAHQKDVATFRAKCNSSDSPVTDHVCREHFVGSGVYYVSDFHCAALSGISASEMQQFAIVV